MFNPSCLVLQLLGEGRIDADEAAVLLRAVVARPTVCAIRAPMHVEPTTVREFLPWTLPSVWSGSTNEVM